MNLNLMAIGHGRAVFLDNPKGGGEIKIPMLGVRYPDWADVAVVGDWRDNFPEVR
ncbi:hypothetical protein JQV27_19170 [Sulfitobacter mediterraneus]|uniref:hypothetical protein n=1 Tax=Sulfitobacter mediterraneus TaxID=83219 RepID=UPI0019347615|nr:hypothetical protein [Sulfitobacter mediterraneus]MBM1634979.1 hypothetical protein [Sulfitobacter mediterraneus]MBM1642732.1 hypothetical protein [Sulfitobacter mediterraneus]MBM1646780.1 hypothetical protein [Sulfitobacter mediterraneus]MBM1650892.1 hypothetical protein [Sulfitobacter mediterraneus]MBM1654848.1 hypothetical protein [Sulfitobacter mediterraneus]